MYPDDLKYLETHEWVRIEGDIACIGISEYAAKKLGDIVFVELPEEGDEIEAGEQMGTIESVKAASEFYAPVSGEVIEVNTELEDAPETVNDSPYEDGWFVKVKFQELPDNLMDPEEYEDFCDQEG
jgi:glycine cleavage system H protein